VFIVVGKNFGGHGGDAVRGCQDIEYMQEALMGRHGSTCGDATPLRSIGPMDIATVMPNTACTHAQGNLQAFPFLLAVPVCSSTKSTVLPRVLFMLPESSSLGRCQGVAHSLGQKDQRPE